MKEPNTIVKMNISHKQPTIEPNLAVENLTFIRQRNRILDSLTFSLKPGEIVGLLGLNGAGKSTLLALLAGCLVPDIGTITIGPHDLLDTPIAAKKKIGYLPETTPLYKDMSVLAYLRFIAQLRGVKKKKLRTNINNMIDSLGLAAVLKNRVGHLSKGYCQRLGIAQAFIHQPSVILLDEPTSGLDVNQAQETRHWIRNLVTNQTILWSTHLKKDIEESCNRLLLLKKGKIIIDESLQPSHQPNDILFFSFQNSIDEQMLSDLPGVTDVQPMNNGYRVRISGSETQTIANITQIALKHHWGLKRISDIPSSNGIKLSALWPSDEDYTIR